MTFASGSRTAQANPAEDLYTLIAAQLTAHGGYTFIEDYTITGFKHSVWRCNAAQNSSGVDYYLIFTRQTVAGAVSFYLGVSEGYTVGTHSVIRPAPNATSTTVTASANNAYNSTTETYALTAAVNPVNLYQDLLVTSTSAYDYWIHVHKDGVNLATRVATTSYGIGCELFESLVLTPATNDPYPVLVYGANTASGTTTPAGGMTRAPFLVAASGALARIFGLGDFGRVAAAEWPTQAVQGSVGGAGNLYQASKAVGSRLLVRSHSQQQATNGPETVGYNRGLFRTLLSYAIAAGVVTGDTVTVGTDVYVYVGAVARQYWVNTSAA